MKKLMFALLCILFLGINSSTAQTFPVYEDFESYSAFSVPPGFSGDINIYLIHGVNRSQCLASNMNSFNSKDSIISPLYGPIDGGSALLYEWRMAVNIASVYPAGTINLVNGDVFETYISRDGVNYDLIAQVDNSNYIPDTTFQTNSLLLSNYGGDNIRLKFVVKRGNNPNEFWVDIDNILIFDVTAVASLTDKDLSFYPTIVTDRLNYTVNKKIKAGVEIYSMDGRKVGYDRIDTETGGSIDLSGLAAGSYVLKIYGNSSVSYRFEKR